MRSFRRKLKNLTTLNDRELSAGIYTLSVNTCQIKFWLRFSRERRATEAIVYTCVLTGTVPAEPWFLRLLKPWNG